MVKKTLTDGGTNNHTRRQQTMMVSRIVVFGMFVSIILDFSILNIIILLCMMYFIKKE
jgi:hypothetical protein